MLKRILVPVMVFAVAYLIMPDNSYAQNKYEGVKVCGICHKTAKAGEQLKHWEGSKHAQAFKTLQTEEAKKYSPDMDATKNPKCLKCHTTGYGEDAKMFGAKFNIEDGVQCEACHGPGSGYKSMKIMKAGGSHADRISIAHEVEIRIGADMVERGLLEHETVQHRELYVL